MFYCSVVGSKAFSVQKEESRVQSRHVSAVFHTIIMHEHGKNTYECTHDKIACDFWSPHCLG